jgi:hypothetical protein
VLLRDFSVPNSKVWLWVSRSLAVTLPSSLIISWLDMPTGARAASGILKIALVGSRSENPDWTSDVSRSTSLSGWSLADLWLPLSMTCWIDHPWAWQVIRSSGYCIPFERDDKVESHSGWFSRRRLSMEGGLNLLPYCRAVPPSASMAASRS